MTTSGEHIGLVLHSVSETMHTIADGRMPHIPNKENEVYNLLKTSWQYQTRHFFQNSTLHGVRYIKQEGRPFYERFMWFCFILTGAVSTLIIIASVWNKFQTNPTITGLDTDFHNWDIMFPSVWLCPQDPFNESKAEKYIKKLWPDDVHEFEEVNEIAQLLAKLTFRNLNTIKEVPPDQALNYKDIRKLLKKVLYSCEELLTECTFVNLPVDCCAEFRRVYTEVGVCYVFNSRHAHIRNNTNTEVMFTPKQILATDETWSLKFNMKIIKKQVGEDSINVPVKVYILQADETPIVDIFPQLTWDRLVSKLSFVQKETHTTEGTRQLSVKQRQCIYSDEMKLDIDSMYTYTGCRSQCRMTVANKLCSCVPFFYPKSSKFKKCSLEGLKCLGQQPKNAWRQMCKCELGCNNTVYEVAKLVSGSENKAQELARLDLEVGFLSWPMYRYKREVLFGWIDLLVSFGGIAGLFLGFSLLSGAEIIYYFFVRAPCMVYRDAQQLRQLRSQFEREDTPALDLSLRPHFKHSKVGIRPAYQTSYMP